MFTESSGSMYEEIENARKKKLRKRYIMKKRIIAIVILVLIVLYLGLFLNDIRRFHKGEKPLITISQKVKEYDDGKVETYTSLGWVETNYTIPDNISKKEKEKGVLFFYDKDENLLGTYKCVLSENDCEVATSAVLDEDNNVRDYNTKMDIINNRYVFIKEVKNANTQAEEKHVYLYDINAKHLIAGYQDVRYTTSYTDDNNKSHGLIDNTKFIIKKNDLWGIDEVLKGRISHFEECKYQYIGYNTETNLYVFETAKDNWGTNKWIAFDANKKLYTAPINEKIDSFYYKNDRIYLLAYVKNETTGKKNYLLYNQEGENVLVKEDIDDLKAYDKFLVYTKDQYLYLIDYDGKELISSIKLNFIPNQTKIKQYYVRIIGSTLIISTPKEQTKTHLTDEYYYDINNWTLTKTRTNVKETTE